MSQLSPKLRGSRDEPVHWCPGCDEMHVLPWKRGGWTFNGDMVAPTFTPSFLHRGRRMGPDGVTPVDHVCHYILTAGVLNFCSDSMHALAGQAVPLPDLPPELGAVMDRAALASELFEIHAGLRTEALVLKLEAGLSKPDLAGTVAAGAAKIAALVERAETVVAGYCTGMDSGARST